MVFSATFVPFCKQLIEEYDTIEWFYHIAKSSKQSRRRLLLQILLQNLFMNEQNRRVPEYRTVKKLEEA